MAQQLQSYGQGPYAEEALRLAEIGRGQEGMSRTAAPVGPNLADGGGMSKPNVNTQPYNNTRLMDQNMGQRVQEAIPGQQANALGQVRKANLDASQKDFESNQFKNQRVAEFLYATDGGNATFQMSIPEVAEQRQRHVAEQKLIAYGINPKVPYTSNRFAA